MCIYVCRHTSIGALVHTCTVCRQVVQDQVAALQLKLGWDAWGLAQGVEAKMCHSECLV